MPPDVEAKNQQQEDEPQLWRELELEDSFWKSLSNNLRDALFPIKRPPLHLESKPIPVVDPFAEESLWVSVRNDVRDLLFPKKLPPLQLESHEVAVQDMLATPRDRQSSIISAVVHLVIIAGLIVLSIWHPKRPVVAEVVPPQVQPMDLRPFLPIAPKGPTMGGGGGGGDRELLQAAKGHLPKIAKTQFVPPQEIIRNDHPKLVVDPTIVMPQKIQLPNNNIPNLGDPTTTVRGPLSNGTGANGGIGSGASGGIGSGTGAGLGPGEGGGYGGGVMRVGGGVLPPELIYSVDPEFSDEARKAKYQGTSVIALIVDANGLPRNIRVLRALGMGLDEKAIAAVKQYRFKPAYYKGHPVPVEIDVEVDFHIY
jgi:TonB family protein